MSLIPIALYWSVAFWGLFSRRPILIWLFFVSLPFGSMAVVPSALTAGLSFVPQAMTAMLIITKELALRRSGMRAFAGLALRGPGLLLFLFWCVSVVITVFAPRLFAGEIQVVPMNLDGYYFLQTSPLTVTKQNISQLAYITISVLAVFVFARIFQNAAHRMLIIRGIMVSGIIVIVTGTLDFASSYLPVSPLLEPFRTANYAILDNVRLGDGAKRVTGLMPEASAFGGLSLTLLSLLWFLRRALTDPVLQRRANLVMAGLAVMLVLSTSSAGYVGIAVFLLVVGLEWGARAGRFEGSPLSRRGIRGEFALALGLIGALAATLIAAPQLLDPVIERLNDMVFTKTESLSYLERSFWTRSAFEAGLSSYGIGVGLGSVRASNFAAALFGSTGILGVGFYFGFILQRLITAIPSRDPVDLAMASGLKWSFFPPFAVSLLIGTTPDFGTIEALRWGVLLAFVTVVQRTHAPLPASTSGRSGRLLLPKRRPTGG